MKQREWWFDWLELKIDFSAVTLIRADAITAFIESETLFVVEGYNYLEFVTGEREPFASESCK